MDFFDDDDAPTRDEPAVSRRRPRSGGRPAAFDDEPASEPPGGGGRPSQQQIRSRQLTFIGAAIVVLILLFLAFRGCLDARKERSFKNYVSDLSSITAETKQLSDEFFNSLSGESDSDIGLENQINGLRATAQTLQDRAQNLDAPDEISGAQSEVALAYQLRSDGVATVADQLPRALGNAGARRATNEIAEQMQVFLASDVLYRRARGQIDDALTNEEIVVEEGVPESEFLPTGRNAPDWLDPSVVSDALSGAGTGGSSQANCEEDGQTHGLGLVSTTAQPSGVVLEPGAAASVPAEGTEFEVAVANQGDASESDIDVSLSGDLSGSQTISSIEPGATETVTIRPDPAPSAGETASVTVNVAPVCGEQVEENNESTYELTFE